MNIKPLHKVLCPGMYYEEDEELTTFFYDKSLSHKQLTEFTINQVFERIRHKCNSTYYVCIHVYIRGHDSITGEQYTLTNDTLDIPFVNASARKVQKYYNSIFYTLAPEPMDGEDNEVFYRYWNAIRIDYFKMIMKRTKPFKKPQRKPLSGKVRLNVFERDDYVVQQLKMVRNYI